MLTQPFKRILKKAGVPVYPKPLQDLRASRETELLDEFPLTDVCSWIGNSPNVAREHYAMTCQESFDRAVGLAKENFVPIHWPISRDSGHLTATGEGKTLSQKVNLTKENQGQIHFWKVWVIGGNHP